MKNKTEKTFDAVKLMRKIREKLSREYYDNIEKERKDLREIHSKFRIKARNKKFVNK